MDGIYWSHLPSLPKKMKWPVKVVDWSQQNKKPLVYCKADDAYVLWENLAPFPEQLEFFQKKANVTWKKKAGTLQAFNDDVVWALDEAKRAATSIEDEETKLVSRKVDTAGCTVQPGRDQLSADQELIEDEAMQAATCIEDEETKLVSRIVDPMVAQQLGRDQLSADQELIEDEAMQAATCIEDEETKLVSRIVDPMVAQQLGRDQLSADQELIEDEAMQAATCIEDEETKLVSRIVDPMVAQQLGRDQLSADQELIEDEAMQAATCIEDEETKLVSRIVDPMVAQQLGRDQLSADQELIEDEAMQAATCIEDEETKLVSRIVDPMVAQQLGRDQLSADQELIEDEAMQAATCIEDEETKLVSRIVDPMVAQQLGRDQLSADQELIEDEAMQAATCIEDEETKLVSRIVDPMVAQQLGRDQLSADQELIEDEAMQAATCIEDEETKLVSRIVDPMVAQQLGRDQLSADQELIEVDAESEVILTFDMLEKVSNSDTESEGRESPTFPPNLTVFVEKQSVQEDYAEDDVKNEIEESMKLRDKSFAEIFVRKVVQSDTFNGMKKKGLRVQNSVHACFFCKKLVMHIQDHLRRIHSTEDEVKAVVNGEGILPKDRTENMKDLLRAKGDNEHNMNVKTNKKGQLLLFRRPTEVFDHTLYGPCPCCLEWMLQSSLVKHQKTCKGVFLHEESLIHREKHLKVLSDIQMGNVEESVSEFLIKEVFTVMRLDNVGKMARSDNLIIHLGETWLKNCIDNTVKRAYWASQHMRHAARLLIEMRKLDKDQASEKSMSEYLRPVYFDILVEASLNTCLPNIDDFEDLKSPSNALKIKYDIITMAERKATIANKEYDRTKEEGWKNLKEEAEGILNDMKREWKTKVTKVARKVLNEKKLTARCKLPDPRDVQKLSSYLQENLAKVELNPDTVTWESYSQLVVYAESRLLIYNKRRSGEIEGITVSNFVHKIGIDDIDSSLIGELSVLEKYLIRTQDLIQVRGKFGRPVPVLIPLDCKKALNFLADHSVRKKVGVPVSNGFLFPNRGYKVISAYECIRRACAECQLRSPERITSTAMRKYMATLAQMWQQTQLLHVFQEPLVSGKSGHKVDADQFVDLRNIGSFEENFFLVSLGKDDGGSTLHMWKIIISSSPLASNPSDGDKPYTMMDYTMISEDSSNPPSRSGSPDIANAKSATARLLVSSTKLTSQKLNLPDGVTVTSANVSAGHLSSASIYPACLAPYLLVTACSDGSIRFWRCNMNSLTSSESLGHNASTLSTQNFEFGVEEEDGVRRKRRKSCVTNVMADVLYNWEPWSLIYTEDETSDIHIHGKPLTVSCAYTGRVAVAYRSAGHSMHGTAPNSRFFNLCVAIYECESTGGSQWIKEDTIELRNIRIPENHVEVDLDLSGSDTNLSQSDTDSATLTLPLASNFINMCRTKSVPSLSALYCAKKEQEDHADKLDILRQKHLVQLDWVSTEDGSHILTVGVGSKILMYAQVSNDIVQESKDTMDDKIGGGTTSMNEPGVKLSLGDRGNRRAMLQKSKSMVVDDYKETLQWMKLRTIDLTTADGLPPLPMHISWVRGGILVVGMDNEMHVYSQWRWSQEFENVNLDQMDGNDIRNFEDRNLSTLDLHKESLLQSKKSLPSIRSSLSVPNFKKIASNVFKRDAKSSANLRKKGSKGTLERSESSLSLTVIHEFGLFEAAHQANPVLPQYHPKSLMELLYFGKVRRVKAILAHLVRCIAGREATHAQNVTDVDDSRLFRQRTVSVSQSPGEAPMLNEESNLDYVEITSIPLLPLYSLLAADNDTSQVTTDISAHAGTLSPSEKSDYKDLFQTNVMDEDDLDTNVLGSSVEDKPRLTRSASGTGVAVNPYHFSMSQAQLLGKHLTHMHLPGLSGQDQMYLLALADTVAQTKTDFAESFETTSFAQNKAHTAETLDDCGLRFLLAMRHYHYLMRSLPPVQRVQLHLQGLKTFNLVWAFHSEATEELLALIPTTNPEAALTWSDLRTYGAGWWIKNINILKRTVEKLAKDAFQKNKEPMDAALFYLAMKKKNVLWGLFRSVENRRMSDFFRNDFKQERWRKAALKNAFDLLGKQRFDHAAGFFLLGGSLTDALEVILDKLQDVQLALVVCRLYDGEDMMSEPVKNILQTHVLCKPGHDRNTVNNRTKYHLDPFLRSMTYWLYKDYRNALQTLLQNESGKSLNGTPDTDTFSISNVFNFYNYLRTHPLLIRHKIVTAGPDLKKKSLISGFTKQQTIVGSPEDEVATCVDKVTPMERRLFFSTAHSHYKNGNPVLALEVLSKLPIVSMSEDDGECDTVVSSESDACINTGNISDFSDSSLQGGAGHNKPLSTNQTADAFDWSQPVTSNNVDSSANILDWSQPVNRFNNDDDELKLDFKISDSEGSESDDESKKTVDNKIDTKVVPSIVIGEGDTVEGDAGTAKRTKKAKTTELDIFAQQYKFIACLKVIMEEMQTLATGFEVDGGQLRFQVYIWLEREVEALRMLCNYGVGEEILDDRTVLNDESMQSLNEDDDLKSDSTFVRKGSTRSMTSQNKATLHEVMIAERMDLDAKMERMGRRKQWLQQNCHLLRTLVAYCVLQGAAGGGISSVQMELLLLIQELQQEKPQQQLLSPLPFPTTLPLLSSAIASSKTVTADPIQHIQCLSQDLLHSVIEFTSPPGLGGPLHTVLVMRNLSVALASCVYQCLCDSDNFVVSLSENVDVGFEGFCNSANFVCDASHLMAGVRKMKYKNITSPDEMVNTPPAKWPGVTSLRVLLAREKDEDSPKLNILLTESLFAVYTSLLINALATYDCFLLYRLAAHKFDSQLWSSLFGGGVKTVVKLGNTSPRLAKRTDELYNQRMRLNMKIIGQQKGDNKKKFEERFVPPELSMITYFMTKPYFEAVSDIEFCYNSDDSMSSDEENYSDDEYDEFESNRPKTLNLPNVHQHSDPSSYAWCIIRYACVRLILHNLSSFLPQIGIELQELPVCSPLLHALLRTLEQWQEVLLGKLDLFAAAPNNFIPGLDIDVVPGYPSTKYKALLNKNNSPFIESQATLPIKRLWFHLIRQEKLRDVFVRYVFKKQKLLDASEREDSSMDGLDSPKMPEPFKIIHKEQDIITAFAINQANASCLTLATQKELIELDIHHLLSPPNWLEDENEMDIESFNHPAPSNPMENVDFLVVQTPVDMPQHSGSGSNTPLTNQSSAASTPSIHLAPGQIAMAQTGRGTNVVSRRPVAGVRRISSHPTLPHYLTGNSDGSVRLWEWGHSQPLAVLRAPGSFPKVTKVLFNTHGNKCCVSDTEGSICLWQVGPGSNFNKPIMNFQCHNKTTSDFVFVGSSSLIATSGQSSESRNICLWDTLLPPRSACVHAFTCHEHGSPALVYAPHHQLLISGGRKGEICIFDIRQRQMRHTFQAHESTIRCLAMDPEEEYFVSGSSDGDVKVWGLDVHQLIVAFQGEHTRSNTFFRSVGSATGVTQVAIGPKHHLFSCGVDGSMKFRALPERDSIVRYWNN